MSMNTKQFGVREGVDVAVKANSDIQIGSKLFKKGEPVIYFDSAKVSSLEGTSAVVWAQGGRGNPNLMAWEGDKTVTFRFEEALISPMGLQILSGANLLEAQRIPMRQKERVRVTATSVTLVDAGTPVTVPALDLSGILPKGSQVITSADKNLSNENGSYQYPDTKIFVMEAEEGGNSIGEIYEVVEGEGLKAEPTSKPAVSVISESAAPESGELEETSKFIIASAYSDGTDTRAFSNKEMNLKDGATYIVDFYVFRPGAQLSISPNKFAGNYRFEIDTLFKRQDNGRDYPAQIIIPNGKIATSFSFSMSPTGDPTSFPFEVEATPAYDEFNTRCKILAKISIADEPVAEDDC